MNEEKFVYLIKDYSDDDDYTNFSVWKNRAAAIDELEDIVSGYVDAYDLDINKLQRGHCDSELTVWYDGYFCVEVLREEVRG